MDLCQIDIAHIVCRVIVADLATSPVDAFDFDDFVGFNGSVRGILGVPTVLDNTWSVFIEKLTCEE
jgi:hypothetical protein